MRVVTIIFQVSIAALLTYLYHPTVADLVTQWSTDGAFGYGFFIPPVAAYLAWERRDGLRIAPSAVAWWGYMLFLGGLVLLMIGRAGSIQIIARGSLIMVLFGLVLFLWGRHTARVLALPLGFLALMIPPPPDLFARMTWPLQLFTAHFSAATLRQFGYPVLLQGVYIDLPDMRLEVAQACSGFRSLIALLATGVVLAYMTQPRWTGRVLLVAAVVPVAILANAVRVTAIIAWGIFADPLHSLSGWLVFVLATAMLMGLAVLLHRVVGPKPQGNREAPA